MSMESGAQVAVDKNLLVSILELGEAAILKVKVLKEKDHDLKRKKIPGKMMTQMMKRMMMRMSRRKMPAVQTVSRKRKKLDPDDFLLEDLRQNLPQ